MLPILVSRVQNRHDSGLLAALHPSHSHYHRKMELSFAALPRSGSLKLDGTVPISLRPGPSPETASSATAPPHTVTVSHTASRTTCYTYPFSTPPHPPEAPQTSLCSSPLPPPPRVSKLDLLGLRCATAPAR
jgi:hypothetical protein